MPQLPEEAAPPGSVHHLNPEGLHTNSWTNIVVASGRALAFTRVKVVKPDG